MITGRTFSILTFVIFLRKEDLAMPIKKEFDEAMIKVFGITPYHIRAIVYCRDYFRIIGLDGNVLLDIPVETNITVGME